MSRYKNSLEYLERAKKVIPGAAQTLSKMPARFPQGAFPVALRNGFGANVWDVDGNQLVDWVGSLGATPLGYGDAHLQKCVADQLFQGSSFSLPSYREVRLAERLCAKIPCAEMVRFVNSGSEATEAAIRTARIWKEAQLGRNDLIGTILVVGSGYNSWFSWFQAIKPYHPGVSWPYATMIGTFNYNNLSSLEKAFEKEIPNGVAAVILEPCLFEKPQKGFLEGVRELCTKNGALLIFDEMVLGFRLALAGGQEYFGVTPDLATFGKGMANGLPIGMLCGKREYMQHAELISGTFGGNAVSLAAVNAVLDVYESEPVIETMWQRGRELQEYFNAQAQLANVNAVCDGYACKPRIRFQYGGEENDLAMSLFLQETAANGVLFHPGGFNVCYALTDDDMRTTFQAISLGLTTVAESVLHNDWSLLKGNIIKPVVTVRQ